ncbi:aldehyde dehydrogenase family protein [Streptomyces acidiscabies]|uniref:Aldehyde dehydrogenase n=1 Tax=Streptomyces acidiscabies TaxID=42234 RepID=A0AAP6ECN1_9ACTN|nr:aldehyde dehydrogenase family protein [Streptomyces acidiscabies]MBP5941481.1 aldehyde dehydrogenase family protein [Streptomyces sp. LBUM 1476]MBZ3912854.1 aldehyde dehydrogenase family protein [Streptomyces acidiscabies]MDX2958338.1 aldehyde dehydrogenase family protein [Streptomyces acidiscabies]MDX3018705.1 aldehyde dehydrogenase family protein [Streptomyces acidiscabies]MDX3790992.1 aldehyde dehydrogenase family protein [Streptomyces acidiscabies]
MSLDTRTTLDAAATVSRLNATFATGRTRPASWRKEQLRALRALLIDRQTELSDALHADLGKSPLESYLTELGFVVNEIDHTLRHLNRWMRPRRVGVPISLAPARARTVREPLGTVLIVSPWNYPLQLALAPLVGALAAGNCAVVKPSELAPATSAALAHWLPKVLDPDAVAVVEGGVPETTELLEQRFDHIFYTGNGAVGRIVMTAAARHLTPVTLELGGKSPAVVEPGADLRAAARRIAWGKFMNAGQTCVAPDYVLAVGDAATEIEEHLAAAVREMYGERPAESADYGRIVNDHHFERLTGLLGDGRTVVGGEHDKETRFIAPTVLADVSPESAVMREEIFGPVLPIVRVSDLDAAISFITARDKPLALYAFVGSGRSKKRLEAETSSGALAFGVPNAHLTVPGLPFGGVGESGVGRYHGSHSIDTFSHHKAVLDKPLLLDPLRVAYPPFTQVKERILRKLV